jgi:hypothetical protein
MTRATYGLLTRNEPASSCGEQAEGGCYKILVTDGNCVGGVEEKFVGAGE